MTFSPYFFHFRTLVGPGLSSNVAPWLGSRHVTLITPVRCLRRPVLRRFSQPKSIFPTPEAHFGLESPFRLLRFVIGSPVDGLESGLDRRTLSDTLSSASGPDHVPQHRFSIPFQAWRTALHPKRYPPKRPPRPRSRPRPREPAPGPQVQTLYTKADRQHRTRIQTHSKRKGHRGRNSHCSGCPSVPCGPRGTRYSRYGPRMRPGGGRSRQTAEEKRNHTHAHKYVSPEPRRQDQSNHTQTDTRSTDATARPPHRPIGTLGPPTRDPSACGIMVVARSTLCAR